MSTTLNQLVRKQILAEGPQLGDGCETQDAAWRRLIEREREWYVNQQLDGMTRAELLERISDAQELLTRELSVRLGI